MQENRKSIKIIRRVKVLISCEFICVFFNTFICKKRNFSRIKYNSNEWVWSEKCVMKNCFHF
jgi:hypothetical protein